MKTTQSKVSFLFSFLIILSVLVSCTNFQRAINTKKFDVPEKPVDNFMVLFVEYGDEIARLDEEHYNKALKGKFNNLEHQRFRDHMAELSWNIFSPTMAFDYRRVFEVHQDYSFEEFHKGLDQPNLEYVLLINMRNDDAIGEVRRMNFQVFLFDKNQENPLWTGFGYYNPGNLYQRSTARRLLNRIKKDLISDGLIMD